MKIIYDKSGKVGEVRPNGPMVYIYLDASFWPERIRDEKDGLQFMGEFHNFNNFKNSGSFEELTLTDTALDEEDWGLIYGVWP